MKTIQIAQTAPEASAVAEMTANGNVRISISDGLGGHVTIVTTRGDAKSFASTITSTVNDWVYAGLLQKEQAGELNARELKSLTKMRDARERWAQWTAERAALKAAKDAEKAAATAETPVPVASKRK